MKTQPVTAFISYSRIDHQIVKELYEGIAQRHKHPTFLDTEEIVGGDQWWSRIIESIQHCRIFIFAISPSSMRSTPCKEELAYAKACGKKVIYVLVRETLAVDFAHLDVELSEETKLEQWFPFVFPDDQDDTISQLDDILDPLELAPAVDLAEAAFPEPPRPPIASLSWQRELVNGELPDEREGELVDDLANKLLEPDQRGEAYALLQVLKQRHWKQLDVDVAERLRTALLQYYEPPEASQKLLRPLANALNRGGVVPILGSGMTDWLLGTSQQLAVEWATDPGNQFPMKESQSEDLRQVAQFLTVSLARPDILEELARFYRKQLRHRFPDVFKGASRDPREQPEIDDMIFQAWEQNKPPHNEEPHRVIAELDCAVFITTNPSSILERALLDAGKNPVTGYCKWKLNEKWPPLGPTDANEPELASDRTVVPWPVPSLDNLPEEPAHDWPNKDNPLVFHMFGVLGVPQSLVISEDDYFDLLVAVATDRHRQRTNSDLGGVDPLDSDSPASDQHEVIPTLVQASIVDKTLLFLGFALDDWDVRVLMRALINPEQVPALSDRGKFKHVASGVDVPADVANTEQAKQYLNDYFNIGKPPINLYWSSVERFASDIKHEMEQDR